MNVIPVGTVEGTAKSIVNSVLRGARCVTVPAWFKVTYFLKIFCPEVLEWTYRVLFMMSTDDTPYGAAGKKILDNTGAKAVLYPPGVHSHEVKVE